MIDSAFGNWLAGFIDGEGCFYIAKVGRPGGHRPMFSLTLRADDADIVHAIHSTLGIGSVHYYRAQSGNAVVRWMVQARDDCTRLVKLLTDHPLRAKKRLDFHIWKQAVEEAQNIRPGRADNSAAYARLHQLKEQLHAVRKETLDYANSAH